LTDLFRTRIAPPDLSYVTLNQAEDGVSDDHSETELRLFAGPSATATTTQKIRVASPDISDAEPSFIVPPPRSYFFAGSPDSQKDTEFEAAAVDGETVMAWSKEPWPGCALPWKVRTILPHGMKKAVLIGHPPRIIERTEPTNKKRTRASKKKRIALRKKAQAMDSKAEEEKRKALEKEQAGREKRTRRNREKKVKKKAKEKAEKAKKSQAGAATETAQSNGGDENMSVG
jgi:hypothetical protein